MIGFLCATPYHIMAAITMATGMYKDKKCILVVMDHSANFDEKFISKISSLGIFESVKLYKSNNKTKLNNLKRLFNAFFVPSIVRDLSKIPFEKFFCLALNFIDAAYLIKKFEKRGVSCEVSFADDGLGSYVSDTIYKPKKISDLILKIKGNKKYLERITKLYVYKPELVVTNRMFELVKIVQSEKSKEALKTALTALWPLDTSVDAGGKIMYFEQPYGIPENDTIVKEEITLLKKITEKYNLGACIKMHPRSMAESIWSDFDVIKSKIPFEAMLIQQPCMPLMYMSNCSTALFSSYLFDSLSGGNASTVMLSKLVSFAGSSLNKSITEFVNLINRNYSDSKIYTPENEKELAEIISAVL